MWNSDATMELPAGGTLDGPLIFVWRNEPTVTIGRHQNPWKECNVAKLENGENKPVPAGTAVGIGDGFDAATGGFVPKEDWETIQDECGVSCGTCKRKHVIESFDKINDATRLPGWGFCRTEDAQKSNPSEHFSALAQVPGSESYQTKCVSNTTGYQACRPNALQPLSPV